MATEHAPRRLGHLAASLALADLGLAASRRTRFMRLGRSGSPTADQSKKNSRGKETNVLSFSISVMRLLKAMRRAWRLPAFKGALWLTIMILLSGTLFYHGAENWTWIESLYFTFMTISTIGAQDMMPQSDFGKIFTIIFAVIGIGVLIALVSMLAKALLDDEEDSK